MTTVADYALFALASYFRQPTNQGQPPVGWAVIDSVSPEENENDFSAVAYRRIGTDEVVIAYTGSDIAVRVQ